jgi:hypothetical protein
LIDLLFKLQRLLAPVGKLGVCAHFGLVRVPKRELGNP